MYKKYLQILYLCVLGANQSFSQVSLQPIHGDKLPPKTIVWTIDDGFDENGPDGQNQTIKVAKFLNEKGIRATFFLTGYTFLGQPPADDRSLIARGVIGSQLSSKIAELVALGHGVGNHTQNHPVLTELLPSEIWYEIIQTQVFLLDENQQNKFHPFRTPGLWWNDYAYNVVTSHPYLQKLSGPIDQDVGGQGFLLNGSESVWVGGDWDCYRRGYSPAVCGALYVNRIKEITQHGAILLMHTRTEYMNGKDGSGDFPLIMSQYIFDKLQGEQYKFVPLESVFDLPVESPRRGRPRSGQ